MLKNIGLSMLFIFVVAGQAAAGNEAFTGIALKNTTFKRVSLPKGDDLDSIVAEQGYFDEKPLVFVTDINDDGTGDYLIKSHPTVCGTGGCMYMLVDGGTLEKKGEFFGGPPIVADNKVNAHHVILMLAYSEVDAATIDVYEYHGKSYMLRRSKKLSGHALAQQLKIFRGVDSTMH